MKELKINVEELTENICEFFSEHKKEITIGAIIVGAVAIVGGIIYCCNKKK